MSYHAPFPHALHTCAGAEFRNKHDRGVITTPGTHIPGLGVTHNQRLVSVIDVLVIGLEGGKEGGGEREE